MVDQHVYPSWEAELHNLTGRECCCNPRYQLPENNWSQEVPPVPDVDCIVIHHRLPDVDALAGIKPKDGVLMPDSENDLQMLQRLDLENVAEEAPDE